MTDFMSKYRPRSSESSQGERSTPRPSNLPGKCESPGCEAQGRLSHSTRGGGPYYCYVHFRDGTAPAQVGDRLGKLAKINHYHNPDRGEL